MCGLAGIFSYLDCAALIDADELLRTRESMIRRGPDGAGLWQSPDQRVGLAHRRLAIIDLTTEGAQPMASTDGRYQIVYNGEIYNYRALKSDLRARGAVFHGESDTEVLLQLYAIEGKAMLSRLRGMYAFAIWDTYDQSLFLARDPFGIKPLYVSDDGKSIRFASQVKALLAGGAVSRSISAAGECGYWIWGHIPEPLSLYEGIRAFEPGTWLKVTSGGFRQSGTFESVANLLGLSQGGREDVAARDDSTLRFSSLRDALLDTVRHHLVSDVPVGLFLSAGIDSTALASLAAECGSSLHTVTLGFEEYRGTPADETAIAERVARQIGTRHQTVWLRRKDLEHAFGDFIDSMDQPSIDGLNSWLVSRAAAILGLKVAISGLGGDEFFGGYPSFRQLPAIRHMARPFSRIPGLGILSRRMSAPMLRRFTSPKYASVLEYGATWEGAYMLRRALRMPWELLCDAPEVPTGLPDVGPTGAQGNRAATSYLEATLYMRNQLLRDADWAGMAHSIELRVPLVDLELTRYISAQRSRGRIFSKRDLAGAANPALPDDLVRRPKTGFTVPVRDWMGPRPAAETLMERGLRGWQRTIHESYLSRSTAIHAE